MNTIKAISIFKISIVITVLYFLSSCTKGDEPSPMADSGSSKSFFVSTTDFSSTSKTAGVVGGDDKEDDDDNRGVPRKQK